MSKHSEISKVQLEELYLKHHWTLAEIGVHFGKTRQRIWQLIHRYDIDTTQAERFKTTCPVCEKDFETTRRRYRAVALRYCSQSCYHAHRLTTSSYKGEDRTGQRLARAVMEKHLGRPLVKNEEVHHLDGNCLNNEIDNIMLFASHSEHVRYHHQLRILLKKAE